MCEYKNPKPTVDVIIENPHCLDVMPEILLGFRKNEPIGWVLPGGFVDDGESNEHAALREAKEETSLDVVLTEQMYTYSDPDRDPRQHNLTTVFIARVQGGDIREKMMAADDLEEVAMFTHDFILKMIENDSIVLGHDRFINDYYKLQRGVSRANVFNPMNDVKG